MNALLVTITAILLLGTIGATLLRPADPEVSLQRNAAAWPPAPYIAPAKE